MKLKELLNEDITTIAASILKAIYHILTSKHLGAAAYICAYVAFYGIWKAKLIETLKFFKMSRMSREELETYIKTHVIVLFDKMPDWQRDLVDHHIENLRKSIEANNWSAVEEQLDDMKELHEWRESNELD